jgi:hypothetical protein
MTKKDKSRRSPADHLPKKRGKRTGRAMPPPEDAKDVNEEVPAGKDAAAGKEQAELLEVQEAPKPAVVDDRFLVSYKKPVFSLAPKSGDKLLALQMMVMLTPEHKKRGLFPASVKHGWEFIERPRCKSVSLIDLPLQAVKLFVQSDDKDGDNVLHLPAAKIINATLSVITKKGEGEALKVIRFLFRVQVPFNRDVAKFAESNYGNAFWMNMAKAQGEMFDDEENE